MTTITTILRVDFQAHGFDGGDAGCALDGGPAGEPFEAFPERLFKAESEAGLDAEQEPGEAEGVLDVGVDFHHTELLLVNPDVAGHFGEDAGLGGGGAPAGAGAGAEDPDGAAGVEAFALEGPVESVGELAHDKAAFVHLLVEFAQFGAGAGGAAGEFAGPFLLFAAEGGGVEADTVFGEELAIGCAVGDVDVVEGGIGAANLAGGVEPADFAIAVVLEAAEGFEDVVIAGDGLTDDFGGIGGWAGGGQDGGRKQEQNEWFLLQATRL